VFCIAQVAHEPVDVAWSFIEESARLVDFRRIWLDLVLDLAL
jgi:hypothetical protein